MDVWRLLSFLLVAAVGLVLAIFGQRTLSGFAGDLVDALSDLPNVVVVPIVVMSQTVLLGLMLGAPIVLVIRGRKRLAGVGAVAIVVAVVALVLIRLLLPVAMASASLAVESMSSVRGPGFPSSAVLAGYSAAAVVANSELSSRWSQMVWTFLGFLVLVRFTTSNRVPLDVVFAIGLGGAVGSLLMIIFGRKVVRVSSARISEALMRAGVHAGTITDLHDPAWPDWSLLVRTVSDTQLVARTVGIHECRSDNLYRTYRRARLKDVGDDDSYNSPRRALAVEAMMSLMAATNGVRTPSVRALEPVGPVEFVIAIDRVEGRSLDMLGDDELSEQLLTDAWQQVAGLRRAVIAHRDLRLTRFLVDPDGRVWIRDFAFGEPGAADSSLDGDVAELLAGTYAKVGAQRAVRAADLVLPPTVLTAALVRLVPVAMTAPTRTAVKTIPGGLGPPVDELRVVTGAGEADFAAIERIRPRSLILGTAREVASVVVHLLLIVIFAFAAGSSDLIGNEFDFLPSGEILLAIGGVLLGIVGVILAVPKLRQLLRNRVFPAIRQAASAMAVVAASPLKMLCLVLGSAMVPLGFVTCLYFSMLAFDGDASFTAIGLVFLTVGALAAAAPTPGGVGAVEAVLLTALTGLGMPAAAALAAVFLYRLITFWLPLAPGAGVFSQFTRRGVI